MDIRDQGEWETLQAELRGALQHQRAAYARLVETQQDLQQLMERARRLIAEAEEARQARKAAGRPGP
jgi:hypothetical protein